ncbi:elongation factor Ts [Candidatus Marinamargulisbacteria bacterium SCGC AG-333-B06]|nr:elongation factor Ts [Candidatus Marinamargulisbacteria bacterium SCGC AG-333-B06]
MSITANQVNELRTKTGVGLMDCKKVLVETNGDIESAIKKLREKGLAKAAKKSDRSAHEGRVFVQSDSSNHYAVILELNCETDFVGSNDLFSQCGRHITDAILANHINNLDQLQASTINGLAYSDFISDFVVKLGENISVKQFQLLAKQSFIETYLHMNGKIGVLVAFNTPIDRELSKGIAMHIAASNPAYLTSADVDPNEVNNEKEIIRSQSLKEGKPEAIIDKIVEGRLAKYFKEICLLEQAYIKDDKQSVKHILPNDSSIISFIRYSLG